MKFSKDFKKLMVPEWTEAYVDYDGLKSTLHQILQYKLRKQPETPLRSLQKKLSLHRTLSGLHRQPSNLMKNGDVENQVIDVNRSQKDDSGQFYRTRSLGQFGGGGELEVEFFRKLDEELNKVDTFFKEKIGEVMDEATLINKQMDALIALRIKVKSSGGDCPTLRENQSHDISTRIPLRESTQSAGTAFTDSRSEVEMSGRSALEEVSDSHGGSGNMDMILQGIHQADSHGGSENTDMILQGIHQDEESTSVPECSSFQNMKQSNGCQDIENNSASQEDPLEILKRVKINNTLESPLSTLKGVFKDSKYDELCFTRSELRKVEGRLKEVFIEFYQKLRLLKHYSFMNLSALSKILKTYEKITSRRAARSYMKALENSSIGNCDEVNNLLESVETTFIKHFSNSNIQKGMKLLRLQSKKEKHSVTFCSGFFSGFSIALLVAVVLRIVTRKLNDKEGSFYMVNVFPLYSFFAYIVLHMLAFTADIYFWRRCRINYPFIFGFKKGTELGYGEMFLLSSGLAVLTLACFLGNLHLDLGSRTKNNKTLTELFPLGLVAIVLIIMLCPFNIIYRATRFFFIKSLFRCLCAPLYKVTLPDFFLADHLTSQIQAIRSLDLYICYYGLGELSRRQEKCQGHSVYNVLYFAVAFIPFWIRIVQCLRRLIEEKDSMQVYNALTYILAVVALIIRTFFELKKGMTWLVLSIVSSAVVIIINVYWDIVIDWGLLRRHSKNAYLRDKLMVPHKSVYFAAMAIDIVLRVAWMQLVLEFNLHAVHKMAITTAINCLEIIRRGIWSFFRIENEHLNNVGKYRAFKSVPLPFNYNDDNEEEEEEDSNKGD